MTLFLTFLLVPPAVWAADRLLFNGELIGIMKDEVRVLFRQHSPHLKARRAIRRGAR